MAKKSLGYVELEWICPNCDSRNPGSREKCAGCGAPQPADVEFAQPAQATILTDQEKIADAQAGPDIHCGYCGARNDATNKTCRQCGADLSEGRARSAGRVLGAHRKGAVQPLTCEACGVSNPSDMRFCRACGAPLPQTAPVAAAATAPRSSVRKATASGGSGRVLLFVVLGIVAALALLIFFSSRTEETVGVVDGVTWARSIEVEGLVPVTKEDWRDEIPSGVPIGQCESKLAHTQSEPAPGAREVCGTPYTVDQGSGYGEVVQDCQYEIYEDWCEFTVEEWQTVDTLVERGSGLNAVWPTFELQTNQREGQRGEEYVILFTADGDEYRYRVDSAEEATPFVEGSRWTLSVNPFNAVTAVEPMP